MPPPLLSFETTATFHPRRAAAFGAAFNLTHSNEAKTDAYWNGTKTDASLNETKTAAYPSETKTELDVPPTPTLGRRNNP
jgi:hypothetical protein